MPSPRYLLKPLKLAPLPQWVGSDLSGMKCNLGIQFFFFFLISQVILMCSQVLGTTAKSLVTQGAAQNSCQVLGRNADSQAAAQACCFRICI